jgi:hypothetical protein
MERRRHGVRLDRPSERLRLIPGQYGLFFAFACGNIRFGL